MPQFDVVIITAKYPGTDSAGRKFNRGTPIAYDRRRRVVVSSDPTEIDAIQRQQNADRFDMEAEDRMARACGLI